LQLANIGLTLLRKESHVEENHFGFRVGDRPHKGNANKFKGTFIEFDMKDTVHSWKDVINAIETRIAIYEQS